MSREIKNCDSIRGRDCSRAFGPQQLSVPFAKAGSCTISFLNNLQVVLCSRLPRLRERKQASALSRRRGGVRTLFPLSPSTRFPQ